MCLLVCAVREAGSSSELCLKWRQVKFFKIVVMASSGWVLILPVNLSCTREGKLNLKNSRGRVRGMRALSEQVKIQSVPAAAIDQTPQNNDRQTAPISTVNETMLKEFADVPSRHKTPTA